jgi:predicted helicase
MMSSNEMSYTEKMGFPAKYKKDSIIYNRCFTIHGIQAKAYEYVVNGQLAIERILARYQGSTLKESSIVNDPSDWSRELNNLSYIFDLLLRVIYVSLHTVDIVNSLPKLNFGTINRAAKRMG